jgi:hypothetical protein
MTIDARVLVIVLALAVALGYNSFQLDDRPAAIDSWPHRSVCRLCQIPEYGRPGESSIHGLDPRWNEKDDDPGSASAGSPPHGLLAVQ